MSRSDSGVGDSVDDGIAERIRKRDEFADDLNARGYTDVLVLRRESGRDALTDARLAIVSHLVQHGDDIESVSDLARRLDRDKGAITRISVDSRNSTSSSTKAREAER